MALLGKGLGNENRFTILQAIMKKPRSVGEIATKVGLSQPAVSQHLKVLKTASLVYDTRSGQSVTYAVDVGYMATLLKKLATDLPAKNRA
jgi:DNA-binding transcriptional ArsR family regulator